MKVNSKKNICIQATVALILLFSIGVSAVQQDSQTKSTTSDFFESMFYEGDVPVITVTVTPPALVFGQDVVADQEFATVEMIDGGVSTILGQAQLPTLSRFIEIPFGATPQLLVESTTWQTTSLDGLDLPSKILPVQPSLVKMEGASVEFMIDNSYYATNIYLPTTFASIDVVGEIRGHNVAFIEISPVQYNPLTGELRIMTQCELRINLPGSDLAQTARNIDRYTTPSFEQQFNSLFINDGTFQGNGRDDPKQEGYLIIVADSFYDAIQPLVTWKESKSFDVTVTKTSEIPDGFTKEKIKAYIVDAYENWPIPPAYILLVGDVAQVPTWTGSETGTCTDLYYVTIDGGNYFADIIISRFSPATVEQVTAMVEKTLYYEEGNFEDNSWIKKAAFIASSDMGGMAEDTHNYVIDLYLTPNNYVCDKIWESQGGNTADITNALNEGRSLCIYSGHGYSGGWATGPYDQSDVQGLQNSGMYPFVCSHACSTNPFSESECFGETWLRVENKGAIAFWGASASTYWDEDDILERRMFQAWWEDNLETIGGMTNMGLYYLYQQYGGGGLSQYYFEAYNVLGDSSVVICRDMNQPPDTPSKPIGPDNGVIDMEYSFTTVTTDPTNSDVYYRVNWGDSVSDWYGPYSSGQSRSFTHAWAAAGTYNVTVKAKDVEGAESGWSDASVISILEEPNVEIGTITGGFGITAVIKNSGGVDATNVNWSISLSGGVVLLGRENTGSFPTISSGARLKAKTGLVFGIGSVDILIVAGEAEKTVTATLFGPFVLNVE
jgi:hypothetical protein